MVIGKTSGFVNDPSAGTGIEKTYSKELKAQIAKRRKKSGLIAVMANGTKISGSFFITEDIRPSDYLRSPEVKSVLLVDAFIDGNEMQNPVLIIINNCQYISLRDNHQSVSE
jgi:hypothetical protein